MAKHNETGLKGEQFAKNFLSGKGWTVLHERWRWQHREIDLIVTRGTELAFVEVKTRRNLRMGYPEASVGTAKRQLLRQAAEAFLALHPVYEFIRFDVVSILLNGEDVAEIRHWENVLI